jgi:SNF2 family DNA or RNA helicase
MDSDGRARTRSPKARAKAVMEFRAGKAQVLCASLNAMALGHNLDVASVVIVEGLPWDFMVMDQFIKRARRLTSKRPVLVYVLMPTESLSTRKYSLLGMKGDSADLALDGKIAGRVESRIDKAKVLRDLISQGVKVDGTEIPEEQVHEVWMRMAA